MTRKSIFGVLIIFTYRRLSQVINRWGCGLLERAADELHSTPCVKLF